MGSGWQRFNKLLRGLLDLMGLTGKVDDMPTQRFKVLTLYAIFLSLFGGFMPVPAVDFERNLESRQGHIDVVDVHSHLRNAGQAVLMNKIDDALFIGPDFSGGLPTDSQMDLMGVVKLNTAHGVMGGFENGGLAVWMLAIPAAHLLAMAVRTAIKVVVGHGLIDGGAIGWQTLGDGFDGGFFAQEFLQGTLWRQAGGFGQFAFQRVTTMGLAVQHG